MSDLYEDFKKLTHNLVPVSESEDTYLVAPNEEIAKILREKYPGVKVYLSGKVPTNVEQGVLETKLNKETK